MTSTGGRAAAAGPLVVGVVSTAVMAVAVLSRLEVVFFAAAAAALAAEVVIAAGRPVSRRADAVLAGSGFGRGGRAVLRAVLLTSLIVEGAADGRGVDRDAVTTGAVLAGLALAHAVEGCRRWQRYNLDAVGAGVIRSAGLGVADLHERSDRSPLRRARSMSCALGWPVLESIVFLGAGVALRLGPWPALSAAALIAATGLALVVAGGARRRAHSRAGTARQRAAVAAALAQYAPRVAVYFNAPAGSTYALDVWLEIIDRIEPATVIVLGQGTHLATMGPTRVPVVVLPTAADLELALPGSVALVLYPASLVANDAMLARPGPRHVLIGHGDSDKAVTYSPMHRTYDQTWVAGPAALDRYLRHRAGVLAEQVRFVGRPQLAGLAPARRPPTAPVTVLYAPTWEGNFEASNYCSLVEMGEPLLRDLLARPGCRVLFKPHPATGQRSAAARVARRRLESLVRTAGHRVVDPAPDALYAAFDASDVLVADVSSLVIDYLATGKPYFVTDPIGFQRADVVSAAGGWWIGRGPVGFDAAAFDADLADALGPDSRREVRAGLTAYFLGSAIATSARVFLDLVNVTVDDVVATAPGSQTASPAASAASTHSGPASGSATGVRLAGVLSDRETIA